MPKSLFFWACFSERKPDPTGYQCHQWPPVLPCHSIPSLLLSGMHFSHSFLFSLPLLSGPWCPRQSGGQCVFGCPRSIHPLWWNGIQWPPLCPVVSIPGSCLVSVRDRELVRGGGGDTMAGQEKSQEHEPAGHRGGMILDQSKWTSRNVLQWVYVNCATTFWTKFSHLLCCHLLTPSNKAVGYVLDLNHD